jgi:hypothetical protein
LLALHFSYAVYAHAGIVPTGKTRWGDDVPTAHPGVYVISTEGVLTAPNLPDPERKFWVPDEVIIYIGRAKQLKRRLHQFRRHVYGSSSPHRGGQAILLLEGAKTITWAEVEDYGNAEAALIEAFCARVGQRPFGNRVRSAKLKL